jgi:thioredoxin-related protein
MRKVTFIVSGKDKYRMFLKFKYLLAFAFFLCFTVNTFSQLSFNDALTKAKQENKKVIVDIYTDWCGWCKKMDAEAYSNEEVKKIIEDNFVFVKLDAEGKNKVTYKGKQYTEEELSLFFDVFSFPTTLFLEPDGKLIEYTYDKMKMKNLPGYFKTEDFKKILNYFKDNNYKDSDLSVLI